MNQSFFCTVGKSELNCDGEFSYWIKYALFPTIVPVSSPLKFSPPSVYEYITLYAGEPARVMPLSVVSLAVKFFNLFCHQIQSLTHIVSGSHQNQHCPLIHRMLPRN